MEKKGVKNKLYYLKKYGGNSLSYLTLADDISYFRKNWNGYIGYKEFFRSILVLGDPIVYKRSLSKVIDDLKENFVSKKCNICFFLCTDKIIHHLKDAGFKGLYVGDEAIVDLDKFDISGKKGWKIRSSVNYAKRNKMVVEEYLFNEERCFETERCLKGISDEWCKSINLPTFRFAFGNVDFECLRETRYFTCKYKDRFVGFINYYPIYKENSYYLDLTRRALDAPRGVIDYLYVTSFNKLKEEGVKKIYIGYSPISSSTSFDPNFNNRMSIIIRSIFNVFYPAKSEFFFKKKYATEWAPNYVFYYPRLSVRMLFSIMHSVCDGGIGEILLEKCKKIL
jgi:phosphatidylglycerol lysyltransferase